MKEFLLVFRNATVATESNLSPEQLQAMMKPWMDWIGGIAAQQKLVTAGNRLERSGAVIRPGNMITNGPYVEVKEAIGGYTIVKAASETEAIALAADCPILSMGGSVEIRAIVPMD